MSNFILLPLLVAALSSSFMVASGKISDIVCGKSPNNVTNDNIFDATRRIVGGSDSIPNSWPWMVEIIFGIKHHCGGALIAPDIVLTAAHCFKGRTTSTGFSVIAGGHYAGRGYRYGIKTIVIHPLYSKLKGAPFDFAVLQLTSKVRVNTSNPICLPTLPPVPGMICIVAGWGRIKQFGDHPLTLQHAYVPIIPTWVCNDVQHYSGRMNAISSFCAGYSQGGIDSCQGDSGGPLFCYNDLTKSWEVQGLVSWGIGCAQPGYPGVYANVYAAFPWIKMTMDQFT